MSASARTQFRLPPVIVVGILAACTASQVWIISFFMPFKVTGQAYLLIISLLSFRYWPPMIQWVKRMPIPHRVVFGLLIGSMILGHYTLNARTYFPYVAWEIFPFVNERDPVTCREFIATTASGKKVRLLVEQLFPSIVQINPLNSYSSESTDHLARALAKVYNEHHADDPVRSVELVNIAVKLHPPANESRSQPSCELLKHYEISSGR